MSATSERSLGELVVAVFERWRAVGLKFVILRNYERLPKETGNDVDVLFLPDQLPLAESTLIETARLLGYQLHNRAEFLPISLFFYQETTLAQIQFDLFDSLRWRGFNLLGTQDVLRRCEDRGLFAVPHPAHEAISSLLTRLIYHGYVKEEYKTAIAAGFRHDPDECFAQLAEMFGDRTARELVMAVHHENWQCVESCLTAMRFALVCRRCLRQPLRTLASLSHDFGRFLSRWEHPPGLTIVLLGADGCGKSSVAERLKEALSRTFTPNKGLQVHWKPVVFFRRRRMGRPPSTDPHGGSPRGRLASGLMLFYHWFEYWFGWWIHFLPVRFRNGLVLVDRYHYDFVVDPRRYRLQISTGMVHWLFGLLPSPDLVFLLDAPPEVLRARKQEVSPEETRRQRAAFRELTARLANGVIIDSAQSLDNVVAVITRHVLTFMHTRQAIKSKSSNAHAPR